LKEGKEAIAREIAERSAVDVWFVVQNDIQQ
jgi:hypothetical protein